MNMHFPIYDFATNPAVLALSDRVPGIPDVSSRQQLLLDTAGLMVVSPTPEFGFREIASLEDFRLTAALIATLQTARVLQSLEASGAKSWNPTYPVWSFLDHGITSTDLNQLLEEGKSYKLHIAALNAQFENLPTDQHVRGSEQQAISIRRLASVGELVKVNPITHLKAQDFTHLYAAMTEGLKALNSRGFKLSTVQENAMRGVIFNLQHAEHLLVIDKAKLGF